MTTPTSTTGQRTTPGSRAGAHGALPEARRALRDRDHLRPHPHAKLRDRPITLVGDSAPTRATRSSSPRAPPPCTWACPPSRRSWARAFPDAPPATASSTRAGRLRRRRRQHRGRGGALPGQHRAPRDRHPSPRQVPLREDPAGQALREGEGRQGRHRLEPHARRGAGRQERRDGRAHQVHRRRQDPGPPAHRMLHRHRPQAQHRPLRGPARDEGGYIVTRTGQEATPRPPASPACSPRATCRTTSTGRP